MELLNKKQLCERYKVSRHYIDLYLQQGMPYIPGRNNGKRFNPEDVEKYLAEITVRETVIKNPTMAQKINKFMEKLR